jgi:hypothetical protein
MTGTSNRIIIGKPAPCASNAADWKKTGKGTKELLEKNYLTPALVLTTLIGTAAHG